MHPVKQLLIERNGLKCMLCGREVRYEQINRHHIKPKAVCKYLKEEIDESYDNGALLCLECHAYVHTLSYWSKEYQDAMNKIRKNKR